MFRNIKKKNLMFKRYFIILWVKNIWGLNLSKNEHNSYQLIYLNNILISILHYIKYFPWVKRNHYDKIQNTKYMELCPRQSETFFTTLVYFHKYSMCERQFMIYYSWEFAEYIFPIVTIEIYQVFQTSWNVRIEKLLPHFQLRVFRLPISSSFQNIPVLRN